MCGARSAPFGLARVSRRDLSPDRVALAPFIAFSPRQLSALNGSGTIFGFFSPKMSPVFDETVTGHY
jgi:hypothetical protein